MSARPMTDTSAVVFSSTCQLLPRPGRAWRNICGKHNTAENVQSAHAIGGAGLDLAAVDRQEGAPEGLCHVGAENEADRKDTGNKGVDVDEIVSAVTRR